MPVQFRKPAFGSRDSETDVDLPGLPSPCPWGTKLYKPRRKPELPLSTFPWVTCSFSLSVLRHQISSDWKEVHFHVMSLILQEVEHFPALSSKASTYLLSFEHISDLGVLAGTHMHDNRGQKLGKQKLVGPCADVGKACQRTMRCTSRQGSSLCLHGRRMATKK